MTVAEQSLVAKWNEVLLDAIRTGSALPTETTYQLFVTHTAIYDAWAAYDASASTYLSGVERPEAEHSDANKAEAISHAAFRALSEFFPEQQEKLDAFMADLGYDISDEGTDPGTAAGVGNNAAATALAARAGDGSNYENRYEDISDYEPVNSADPGAENAPGGAHFDPNHWQPLRVPTGTVTDADADPIATDVRDPALIHRLFVADRDAQDVGGARRVEGTPAIATIWSFSLAKPSSRAPCRLTTASLKRLTRASRRRSAGPRRVRAGGLSPERA